MVLPLTNSEMLARILTAVEAVSAKQSRIPSRTEIQNQIFLTLEQYNKNHKQGHQG